MDEMMPDLDGDFVGKEEPLPRIVVVELARGGFRGQPSEDVARGEVEMVARAAEKLAQGALSRAGGAKDQDRAKQFIVVRN